MKYDGRCCGQSLRPSCDVFLIAIVMSERRTGQNTCGSSTCLTHGQTKAGMVRTLVGQQIRNKASILRPLELMFICVIQKIDIINIYMLHFYNKALIH
jgi:hypothetical protein